MNQDDQTSAREPHVALCGSKWGLRLPAKCAPLPLLCLQNKKFWNKKKKKKKSSQSWQFCTILCTYSWTALCLVDVFSEPVYFIV